MSKKETDSVREESVQSDSYAAAAGALGLKKEDVKNAKVAAEEKEDDPQLQKDLEELRVESDKSKEQMLRAMAELENMRRIAQRDISNAHKYSIEKMAKELLPAMDSLEQGIEAAKTADEAVVPMKEGMELTYKMLIEALQKFKIKQLDPIGEAFDPEYHEAMSMQESAEHKPNEIMLVVQKGYLLHDRVIRPARVIVAKALA